MASSSSTSATTGIFDPRTAFPAATDSLLNGLRANFNQHIDWLDEYLHQVKEADVLRVKSSNIPSALRGSPSSRSASNSSNGNGNDGNQGLWVNILKSPARKRVKESTHQQDHDLASTSKPISSLSYSPSIQSKQKNIFSTDHITTTGATSSNKPLSRSTASSSSSGSLSRSPAKSGLKSLANVSTYYEEEDKENAPSSFSRSTSSNRLHGDNSNNRSLNRSATNTTPRSNVLSATTTASTTARSPGIRSPLQSSTSKAQRQAQSPAGYARSSNLSASAPASPLRSPGNAVPRQQQQQAGHQSPLTRSQRLTQTTSEADASPYTSTASASAAAAAKHGQAQRQTSPSPTPRPATRVLRSPTATNQNSAPASPRFDTGSKLLSPLAAGLSKIATPTAKGRSPSGTRSYGKAASASTTTTPVRVVDDVFTLPSTEQENEEGGEDSKGTDYDEDDEEEIENILLGYTKTPATNTSNKVLKSDAVRNGATTSNNAAPAAASSAVSVVVEIPIREKALPPVPQQNTAAAVNAQVHASRISPPRPAKSPARPVSTYTNSNNNTHNNAGKGVISSINHASKVIRPTAGTSSSYRNHSPVKRDMSHLASIASLLSPTRARGQEEEKRPPATNGGGDGSRPASPQLRSHSRVPVPQSATTSATNSPARPRSPVPASRIATGSNTPTVTAPASPSSRPVSPSRISSRIAALAGAARGVSSSSREASPRVANNAGLQPQPTSPRFGLTRSPRLKQALRMDSPSSSSRTRETGANVSAAPIPAPSGLPTPTKMKRPMISPIQSPNSQRALALSSLRKAVPGFETNAFTSPPASPRIPSTTSISTNIHHLPPVHSAKETVDHEAKQQIKADAQVRSQLQKDEELINQHAQAINALERSLPPPPSPSGATATTAKAKPSGLSPPAKSPLRKLNSQLALNAQAANSPSSGTNAPSAKAMAPTPGKDANETVMPQTVVKKVDTDTIHSTAHKDSTVEIPPPSPVFSSFLTNNKRTSTLSFAGLPGRTFGGANGREKSIGLGLGLGKSLGATSSAVNAAKDRIAQAEEQEIQGNNTNAHTRQSFYTAALASQSRKRLSSTFGHTGLHGSTEAESQGSKASRTDFSHTARSSILASQTQQQQPQQPMSQSARFDLLRSRISNIKGTTGYVPPSSASLRSSIATSAQPTAISVNPNVVNSVSSKPDHKETEKPEARAFDKAPTASSLFSPTGASATAAAQKDIGTLPTSATSTFAATIASFVPAPAFGTSFASLFGAGALRATKPDSPAKNTHEQNSTTSAAKKAPQSALYPSLPSMNNLNLPMASFTSPDKRLHGKELLLDADEEQIEELASPLAGEDVIDRARSVLPSSPPTVQRQRSSSVQSIVSAIEAKEAEARQERQREASLSPGKLSGVQLVPLPTTQPIRASAPRSTTPTFSPPKQDLLPRLSFSDKQGVTGSSSRPESRLSDIPVLPVSDDAAPNLSIAGMVDIEDPGLDAIPRASFSDDTELPTTDAVSETEDEEMDQADDEADIVGTAARHLAIGDRLSSTGADTLQQSAVPPKQFRPNTNGAGNLTKSTFKPTRPNKDTSEIQRPVHRPPSRAPSVSSLAPSRASTVSLASTSSLNPSRPGTSMSTNNRKPGNLSVSANARPEIKSLQNAAAAAKKEQVERERKAAVKEERDQKRAAFLAAKREEQDSQASQGDRNGAEKKRKDREELNSSMAASSQSSTIVKAKTVVKTTKTVVSTSKGVDEQAKKRKVDGIEVVVHKPPVPKTTVPRPAPIKAGSASQPMVSNGKQAMSSSSNTKALAASVNSIGIPKQAPAAGPSRLAPQAASSKAPLFPTKPGGNQQALLSQHQQAILSASAAFGKSQPAAKASTSQQPPEPEEPEPEPFQLPEIDSEYSDSDEDVQAQKAALRPVWTHSPELRQALAVQATFDPDQLFGEMPALRMEEIFKNPATMARLRHRTSSAHWSGPDAISRYEEKEYAKRMGFKRVQDEEPREGGPSNSKR